MARRQDYAVAALRPGTLRLLPIVIARPWHRSDHSQVRTGRSGQAQSGVPRTRLLAVAVLLIAATLAACGGDELRPLRQGDRAPAYAAVSLDGDSVSVPSSDGRPVLLNVWATWCPPCRQEMPALEQLHQRFGDRIRVVGVSVDRGGEDTVRRFVEDFDLSFTIVHDPAERITRTFRTSAVPETFLIGADGRIVHRWIGGFDPLAGAALEMIMGAIAPAE